MAMGGARGEDLVPLAMLGCPISKMLKYFKESDEASLNGPYWPEVVAMDRLQFLGKAISGSIWLFVEPLMTWNPTNRPTASEALGEGDTFEAHASALFWEFGPLPCDKSRLRNLAGRIPPKYPEVMNSIEGDDSGLIEF